MPDLLVAVLEVDAGAVRAALGEVDRPGAVLRQVVVPRGADLLADVRAALAGLEAAERGPVLLALAVPLGGDVAAADTELLRAGLGEELPEGWGLPALLPVVLGPAEAWRREGAAVPDRPALAAAVVAAARSVGAHAHLPASEDT